MQTYISLLRGINVSGQKKIKMADLKAMYLDLDFKEVTTYIQSGNVLFKSKKSEASKLEQKIKAGIQKTFGFDVQVLVLTVDELIKMEQANPYRERAVEHKFLALTIMSQVPDKERVKELKKLEFPGEEFEILDRVVYLCCPNGFGRSKLTNNFFESKLKVDATSRNLRSVRKLIELAKEIS